MYKNASKLKLRFQTTVGTLSVEQLWELSLANLDSLAIILDEEYKQSGKKSFLITKSKKDKVLKLKLDIVVDILTTKVEEKAATLNAIDNKAHNATIESIIASKKADSLQNLSIEELEAKLK